MSQRPTDLSTSSPARPGCSAATSPSGSSPAAGRVRPWSAPGATPGSSKRSASSSSGRPDRPRCLRPGRPGRRGRLPLRGEGGRLGDLGEFQTGCIDATREPRPRRRATARVGRFLHISSTSAYGHPAEGARPIDETAPMGQNIWVWDPYTRSKVESRADPLASSPRREGSAVTVIRPSWLYGERDRTTTARLVEPAPAAARSR